MFFDRIEPAYAFGRAGRMASAGDITSYGVYEADHEVRWDEDQGRDVRTLHVATDTSLREHADDQDLLMRWVRGTSPRSAYYQPPESRRRLEPILATAIGVNAAPRGSLTSIAVPLYFPPSPGAIWS
jgi:hypothetical protein